ncbi:uncharacterized protein LOC124890468, partial [Capsicum annuum]|uniref:uncharacterized protein LOC124890468 n=1 Tax=Capsicum annuum TaxID=4072 RepID=UPI001FB096DB
MVHRMLMYSIICKANAKANNKGIAKMIMAGFISQLKGWWDNYLTKDHKTKIIQSVVKTKDGQEVMNAVYTLIINIIEHFSGRWSDNSESSRTMLQNLRCKTLTSWKWYKDVFLSRVMELPESNSPHWKSEFVDGLPMLFAERVKKTLKGPNVSISYAAYTYGNLIKVITQGSLALCNVIKLNQQVKKYHFTERQRVDHFAKDCKVNSKIKRLTIDYEIKESLCKTLPNSSPENSSPDHSDNKEQNDSIDEDLGVLHQEDYMPSEDECIPCQEGQTCENKEENDLLYNIIAQFQDIEINVLEDDKLAALLEMLKELSKENDKPSTISSPIQEELHIIPFQKGSYTMTEVNRLLRE